MPQGMNRLRLLRDRCGATQAEVAGKLNMSRATLSNYESGLTPSIDNAIALARYYGVSLDYILGLSDERNPNIGSLASMFMTLGKISGKNAPTGSDVAALIEAATKYLEKGAPCGDFPLTAWRNFTVCLTECLMLAVEGDVESLLDKTNSAVIAALEITKMPALLLAKIKGDGQNDA